MLLIRYVSPYRGEGFNIPVLEAASCGCPVVVTSGGATEDFVTDEFALRVASEEATVSVGDGRPGGGGPRVQGRWLLPNEEHLLSQMARVMHDDAFVASAREAAPRHVRARFSWRAATDALVEALRFGISEAARMEARQQAARAVEEETCTE